MTALWRNREFNLLWTGLCFSELGDAVARLALPLLVLILTGSPVQAGVVGTIALVTGLVCRLPVGVLVDRVNRRTAMLAADAVRLAAFAGLAALIATGHVSLPVIIGVAVVDTAAGTVFGTAESAALNSIVPAGQLPAAVARNEARRYGISLAGPPLGGLLFGIGHALPFLGNAVSYLASMIGVGLIRRPLQGERAGTPDRYASALTEGLRYVAREPFLRAVLMIAAPLNFAINGVIFTIVVSLQGRVLSVIFLVASSAAAAAPLLAGLLVTHAGSTVTVLVFAASVAVSAVTAAVSPGLRQETRSPMSSDTVR